MTEIPKGLATRGLRDRLNRIAYVVINVSDLDRSRRFYETIAGLRVTGEISAPRQRLTSLGIAEGRFDGLVLQDRTGGNPTAVHLVRWLSPEPVGRPYPVFWHVGLVKLGIRIPDMDAKLDQLRQFGIAPTNAVLHRRYLTVLDPDGVIVSMPETPEVAAEQLLHVNVSARDLEVSTHFYEHVLGLTFRLHSKPCSVQPASQGPGSDTSLWESQLFHARGDARFHVDVSQFRNPAPLGRMLQPYDAANHLGIVRIGFEVDDIAAARRLALRSRLETVSRRERWNHGPSCGILESFTLRDPNGIRLEFVQERKLTKLVECRDPAPGVAPLRWTQGRE